MCVEDALAPRPVRVVLVVLGRVVDPGKDGHLQILGEGLKTNLRVERERDHESATDSRRAEGRGWRTKTDGVLVL